eukprot:g6528.t1
MSEEKSFDNTLTRVIKGVKEEEKALQEAKVETSRHVEEQLRSKLSRRESAIKEAHEFEEKRVLEMFKKETLQDAKMIPQSKKTRQEEEQLRSKLSRRESAIKEAHEFEEKRVLEMFKNKTPKAKTLQEGTEKEGRKEKTLQDAKKVPQSLETDKIENQECTEKQGENEETLQDAKMIPQSKKTRQEEEQLRSKLSRRESAIKEAHEFEEKRVLEMFKKETLQDAKMIPQSKKTRQVENQIRSLFYQFDVSHTGMLNKKQVGKVAEGMGDKLTTLLSHKKLDKAFDEMASDTNGHGVTYEAFVAWHHRNHPTEAKHVHSQIQYLYNKIDVTKSNALEKKDVVKLLKLTGNKLTGKFGLKKGKAAEDAFHEMDVNADGFVSYNEFLEWHCAHHSIDFTVKKDNQSVILATPRKRFHLPMFKRKVGTPPPAREAQKPSIKIKESYETTPNVEKKKKRHFPHFGLHHSKESSKNQEEDAPKESSKNEEKDVPNSSTPNVEKKKKRHFPHFGLHHSKESSKNQEEDAPKESSKNEEKDVPNSSTPNVEKKKKRHFPHFGLHHSKESSKNQEEDAPKESSKNEEKDVPNSSTPNVEKKKKRHFPHFGLHHSKESSKNQEEDAPKESSKNEEKDVPNSSTPNVESSKNEEKDVPNSSTPKIEKKEKRHFPNLNILSKKETKTTETYAKQDEGNSFSVHVAHSKLSAGAEKKPKHVALYHPDHPKSKRLNAWANLGKRENVISAWGNLAKAESVKTQREHSKHFHLSPSFNSKSHKLQSEKMNSKVEKSKNRFHLTPFHRSHAKTTKESVKSSDANTAKSHRQFQIPSFHRSHATRMKGSNKSSDTSTAKSHGHFHKPSFHKMKSQTSKKKSLFHFHVPNSVQNAFHFVSGKHKLSNLELIGEDVILTRRLLHLDSLHEHENAVSQKHYWMVEKKHIANLQEVNAVKMYLNSLTNKKTAHHVDGFDQTNYSELHKLLLIAINGNVALKNTDEIVKNGIQKTEDEINRKKGKRDTISIKERCVNIKLSIDILIKMCQKLSTHPPGVIVLLKSVEKIQHKLDHGNTLMLREETVRKMEGTLYAFEKKLAEMHEEEKIEEKLRSFNLWAENVISLYSGKVNRWIDVKHSRAYQYVCEQIKEDSVEPVNDLYINLPGVERIEEQAVKECILRAKNELLHFFNFLESRDFKACEKSKTIVQGAMNTIDARVEEAIPKNFSKANRFFADLKMQEIKLKKKLSSVRLYSDVVHVPELLTCCKTIYSRSAFTQVKNEIEENGIQKLTFQEFLDKFHYKQKFIEEEEPENRKKYSPTFKYNPLSDSKWPVSLKSHTKLFKFFDCHLQNLAKGHALTFLQEAESSRDTNASSKLKTISNEYFKKWSGKDGEQVDSEIESFAKIYTDTVMKTLKETKLEITSLETFKVKQKSALDVDAALQSFLRLEKFMEVVLESWYFEFHHNRSVSDDKRKLSCALKDEIESMNNVAKKRERKRSILAQLKFVHLREKKLELGNLSSKIAKAFVDLESASSNLMKESTSSFADDSDTKAENEISSMLKSIKELLDQAENEELIKLKSMNQNDDTTTKEVENDVSKKATKKVVEPKQESKLEKDLRVMENNCRSRIQTVRRDFTEYRARNRKHKEEEQSLNNFNDEKKRLETQLEESIKTATDLCAKLHHALVKFDTQTCNEINRLIVIPLKKKTNVVESDLLKLIEFTTLEDENKKLKGEDEGTFLGTNVLQYIRKNFSANTN